MTIGVSAKLLGDVKLDRTLKGLGKAARPMMRKALRAAAKIVKKKAQIHYRSMTGPGNDTILLMKVAAKLKVRAAKRSRVFIGVRVRLPTREAIGYPAEGKWKNFGPVHAELGTKDTPAFPGLRMGLRDAKDEARQVIKEVLWSEIQKYARSRA